MKYKIFTLLLIWNYVLLFGQSNIRFNNFWDHLYTVNPAAINDSYFGEVNMGTRKQWVNFPGSPVTMFTAASLYLEDIYSQFGLQVTADKIGYTTTSDIKVSYGYAVYLNQLWQLNLGISGKFQSFSYDISKIITTNPNENFFNSFRSNDVNPNVDLGFEFSHYNWRFGGASQNFLSLFKEMKINDIHLNSNLLYALYKQNTSDYVNFGGGVAAFQTGNIFQAEMNLSAFFKRTTEDNAFQVGAFYRTWHEMGVLFGIHFDRFRIFYSYDFNVGQIYRKSLGTHEIILSYKLNRTYKCRNCWY